MNDGNKQPSTRIFVSCLRATELLSKSHDAPLSGREQLALRLHLLICGWCRRYGVQIDLMGSSLREHDFMRPAGGPTLSAEARDRIRRAWKE